MRKASSLSQLGFDADSASSGFFRAVADGPYTPTSHRRRLTKVSVIGAGNVGMAIAQTILTRDIADEIALVDALPDKLRGEMLDLQHAAAFLPRTRLVSDTDLAVTKGSDLAIVTAGARQIPGETRLNLLQRNVALFRKIVPALAEHSPDALLLIVSNPVDILTYVAWKLSGFPVNRVIGSGTNLDSSRFRFLLAEHLDVNAQDVQAYMVGEHGDSSVAIWSTVSVAGMSVLKSLQESHSSFDEEALEGIRRAVVNSAYEVIGLKGYTSWAIGYSVANLVSSLLRDQRRIHPVSVLASGFNGIPEDRQVFLSLPARLGRGGVHGVVDMELTEEETRRLQRSAKTLWENCQLLGL
ncbi:L-lactate dehydrogenase A-like [Phragmites australis]|uniref:L-lactate dehydrogenase A-like n=1 Tax=Phragmites australis TaxID=29695 RepID=UPI002D7804A6|nr:L-lactate dehydrogenase A-like [Phragmites australis]